MRRYKILFILGTVTLLIPFVGLPFKLESLILFGIAGLLILISFVERHQRFQEKQDVEYVESKDTEEQVVEVAPIQDPHTAPKEEVSVDVISSIPEMPESIVGKKKKRINVKKETTK